jgi:hypothetical protein
VPEEQVSSPAPHWHPSPHQANVSARRSGSVRLYQFLANEQRWCAPAQGLQFRTYGCTVCCARGGARGRARFQPVALRAHSQRVHRCERGRECVLHVNASKPTPSTAAAVAASSGAVRRAARIVIRSSVRPLGLALRHAACARCAPIRGRLRPRGEGAIGADGR